MKQAFGMWEAATDLTFSLKSSGSVHIEVRFEKPACLTIRVLWFLFLIFVKSEVRKQIGRRWHCLIRLTTSTIYLILSGRWLRNTFIVIFKSSLHIHNIARKCGKDRYVQKVNIDQEKMGKWKNGAWHAACAKFIKGEERLVIVQGFRCNPMNLRVVT